MKSHSFAARAALLLLVSLVLSGEVSIVVAQQPDLPGWKLIGWNNLGMHCMDDDFSVFSILPPFNTVNAQLIDPGGRLVTDPGASGIRVTFEAVADPDGSINTTSLGKTNFWQHVEALFGATLPVDAGLAGYPMPGPANEARPMGFDASMHWFGADGIPIAPTDDAGITNAYPMMRLKARDGLNRLLATTDVVLPVSDEMDCRACHSSGSGDAAKPTSGWAYDPDDRRDFRLNILRLHDERQTANPLYGATLSQAGYDSNGLYAQATAVGGGPVLCARCHSSEALPGSGVAGVPPLTRAMHGRHAAVIDPSNGMALDDVANRSSCYQCHPGSATRCLRGAMGAAVASDGTLAMQCQSCHGSMSDVASPARTGWLDEPVCQSCHTGTATSNNGQIRYTSVIDNLLGTPRIAVDDTFATNPDTPAAGHSLYRFSEGHGGLQCSACHGSTHAIYPSSHRNDNLQNIELQGHAGTIAECTACHASEPHSIAGGPHGMHPTGAWWLDKHGDHVEHNGASSCAACHGADFRGTVLSRAFGERTIVTSNYGTKHLWKGFQVTCYTCHRGPNSDDEWSNQPPRVVDRQLIADPEQPTSIALQATDPNGGQALTIRIVGQPAHGTVALEGATATYRADPGFRGPDSFTYAASDGNIDSNLGRVSVQVGSDGSDIDSDSDGASDLLEYALGLSPFFPSTAMLPQPAFEQADGDDHLTLILPGTPSAPDARAVVEVSDDLVTWHSDAAHLQMVQDSDGRLHVQDRTGVSQATQRFMRIRIVRP